MNKKKHTSFNSIDGGTEKVVDEHDSPTEVDATLLFSKDVDGEVLLASVKIVRII